MDYYVTITETVYRSCVVKVTADDKDEARTEAEDMWDRGDIDYNDMEEVDAELSGIYVSEGEDAV